MSHVVKLPAANKSSRLHVSESAKGGFAAPHSPYFCLSILVAVAHPTFLSLFVTVGIAHPTFFSLFVMGSNAHPAFLFEGFLAGTLLLGPSRTGQALPKRFFRLRTQAKDTLLCRSTSARRHGYVILDAE